MSQPKLDDETFAQMRNEVARFTQEVLIPAEREVERTDSVPDDIIDQMKAMGLYGLSIPQDYGGMGLSLEQEIDLLTEVAQAALSFRSCFGTNVGIGSQGIVMDGTPEQKAAWLPKLATGDAVASFALTEPEAGSDAGSVLTTAATDGDHFIINGTKRFITNASRASILCLMARTDPSTSGGSGVSAFIVPTDTIGIEIGPHDHKMGQRGTRTHDISFNNVRVPANAIIGGQARLGQGFRTAMKVLDRGRVHIAALAIAQSRRLINETLRYAAERRQFGQPIANFQLVQAMLADSRAELFAAWSMTREVARRFDAGHTVAEEAACAKMFATEACGRIADRAVQIFGGAGYMAEYPIERIYRDVRLMRIYEGTTQIQQLIIAKNMLKQHAAGVSY